MKEQSAILDHNLGLLLQRAYVPALPAVEFRERLESSWIRELERRARERERTTRRFARPLAWAAAALVTLVLGSWGLFLATRSAPGLEQLVAEGSVAVRFSERAAWRALGEEERRSGVSYAGQGYLELVTPVEPAASISVTAAGDRLVLGSDTTLRLESREEELSLALRRGSLEIERHGPSDRNSVDPGDPNAAGETAWTLATPHGALGLGRVEMRVSVARSRVTLVLDQGNAWVRRVDGPSPVPPGLSYLSNGSLSASVAATSGAPSNRKALEDTGEGRSQETEDEAELQPDPTTAILSGRVTDAESGEAIPRFRIVLRPERLQNELEDTEQKEFEAVDGDFAWEGIAPRRYDVFVYAEGYAIQCSYLVAFEAGIPVELDAALGRGGSLRGYVVDAATGAALPGARVLSETDSPAPGLGFKIGEIPLWLPQVAETASDGSFVLVNLSPGEHYLHVEAEGMATNYAEVEVREGEVIGDVLFELAPGGAVTGRATRDDGAPFVGADVLVTTLYGEPNQLTNFAISRTDAEGRYRFDNLPPSIQLIVVFLGDHSKERGPRVRPTLLAEGGESVIDFLGTDPGARVFGRILEADGSPAAFLNVGLFHYSDNLEETARTERDWEATTTTEDGSFSIEPIAVGPYFLFSVEGAGARIQVLGRVDVPAGWPEVHAEFRQMDTTLSGVTLDDTTGHPLPGTTIVLDYEDPNTGESTFGGMTRSGPDGRFEFGGLPYGDYSATAFPKDGGLGTEGLGFERSEPGTLSEQKKQTQIVLRHGPGARADVTVVDENGAPIPGANLFLFDEVHDLYSYEDWPLTDERGEHTLAGIRPGSYEMKVLHPDYQIHIDHFSYEAGSIRTVRIVLKKRDSEER